MVAAAPFLYVVANAEKTPVVVAGTKLEELSKLEPAWRIEGDWNRLTTTCIVLGWS